MTDDLLTQARQLALIDVGKPKQTNLRRAISAVYYAVFHLFVDETCRVLVGAQNSQRGYEPEEFCREHSSP